MLLESSSLCSCISTVLIYCEGLQRSWWCLSRTKLREPALLLKVSVLPVMKLSMEDDNRFLRYGVSLGVSLGSSSYQTLCIPTSFARAFVSPLLRTFAWGPSKFSERNISRKAIFYQRSAEYMFKKNTVTLVDEYPRPQRRREVSSE